MPKIKNIIVASLNPVKIEAARQCFERAFPEQEFIVSGVAAKSGVSDQPLSNEETKRGASNRLESAKLLSPGADFYMAFEGGVEDVDGVMEEFAWALIISQDGKRGEARSASFIVPAQLRKMVIEQGLEMGNANDLLFNLKNSKQAGGVVSGLTNGIINRTDYYVHMGTFALLPFIHPELY
ncbi:DUF84 family protein [Patescibacteria group bacterium]|nr:DUF84 family protein [Patescibacteria group bacterium]